MSRCRSPRAVGGRRHRSSWRKGATDIPVALIAFGVRYTFYSAQARGFAPFAAWVASALDVGDPVLAGVKVLPTQHPEWGLDHFVLVVGHGDQGLLVNTTWGDRRWVRDTDTPGADMTATREELEAELTIPASEGSWFQCVKR